MVLTSPLQSSTTCRLSTWRGKEWKASPAVAPLRALRTAPEALIIVAGVDVYYGENIGLYENLKKAGVPVVLKVWPKAVHSFLLILEGSQNDLVLY